MPVTTGPIHGRSSRILLEGQDLSCQLREASIQLNGDTVEATAFCNSLKAYLAGLPEGRMTMSGFLDAGTTGGNFSIIMPKFAVGQLIRFVIQPQGNVVMGLAVGASGYVTSVQLQNQVADVEMLSMEVQLTGELYSMRTLVPITSAITGNIATRVEVQRTVAMETPYTTAPQSGMLYYQFRNAQTTARTVSVRSKVTSEAAAATAGGLVTPHATASVAAGSVSVGVAGTFNTPITIQDFTSLWVDNAASGAEINYGYLGMVDLNQSLLNR